MWLKAYPSSKSKSVIDNSTFPLSTVIVQVQSASLGIYSPFVYPGELIVPFEEPSIVTPLTHGSLTMIITIFYLFNQNLIRKLCPLRGNHCILFLGQPITYSAHQILSSICQLLVWTFHMPNFYFSESLHSLLASYTIPCNLPWRNLPDSIPPQSKFA